MEETDDNEIKYSEESSKDDEKPEYTEDELREAIDYVKGAEMPASIKGLLIKSLKCVSSVNALLGRQKMTIRRLRRLFGVKTEKKNKKNPGTKDKGDSSQNQDSKSDGKTGHGRNHHDKYKGATEVIVAHTELEKGSPCPTDYCDGKFYPFNYGVYVRITGGPLLSATVYKTEKLRCNLCLTVFEAPLSLEIKDAPKYDNKALAVMILGKYFLATPFYRAREFQDNLGVPLPASTCSEKIGECRKKLYSLFIYMAYLAAQKPIVGFDDTKIKVLQYLKENEEHKDEKNFGKDFHTSVLVASDDHDKIVLFRTGRQHAGQNFADMIAMREDGLPQPIAASDALPAYSAFKKNTTDVLCLIHARRQFYDLKEVHYFLYDRVTDTIDAIFENDQETKEMTKRERLEYHQSYSRPLLNDMMQIVQDRAEGLQSTSPERQACNYLINHWNPLTTFMRVEGAPLDTNEEEREIKQMIKVRKTSLFFKTERGANMADDFMGLIETCRLSGVNTFDYLEWALDNHEQVSKAPWKFTPMAYKKLMTNPIENRPPPGYHLTTELEASHDSGKPPPFR